MVNRDRMIHNFIELAEFDSESFSEKAIGEFVHKSLEDLGLEVRTDTTDEKYLAEHPDSYPNIYGFWKGNVSGDPILFSAHLDTVAPGIGKKAIVGDDGRIRSDGSTVLGADDISGLVSILEAIRVIQENGLNHPDIEVLITVAEEPFCEGARYFDYRMLKAKQAYVLDLNGPIGTAAIKAPSIISFEIEIKGKAAHAGFAPEEGINALNIAVAGLSELKTGHIDSETTVNFGTISGGTGKNIVPEKIVIAGEIRSTNHEKASMQTEKVFRTFHDKAKKAAGIAYCCKHEHIRAFERKSSDAVAQRFMQAAKACEIEKTDLITTFGGSDGNRLNEHGIQTMVLACAMENVHTTTEYVNIEEFVKSAELTLQLMTI